MTIVAARADDPEPARPGAQPPFRSAALDHLQQSITRIAVEMSPDGASAERPASAMTDWARVSGRIASAVANVDSVLAEAGAALGSAGADGWSPRGGGYGCFRRVLVNGESVAWLRTEVPGDGRLVMTTRAHRDDRILLNRSVEIAAERVTTAAAVDLLAEVLRPAAEYAAWQRAFDAGAPGPESLAPPIPLVAEDIPPEVAATAAIAPPGIDFERVTDAALAAVNGALAPAHARLVPDATAAAASTGGPFECRLAIEVDGRVVARLRILQGGDGLDVTAGDANQATGDLARGRRLGAGEITVPMLAEAIAAIAWGPIAHARATAAMAAE